jgi:hypothetical protein
MSRYDYEASLHISAEDPPFAALIMAAMRKADSHNMIELKIAFPDIYEEFLERYHAPGGRVPTDPPTTN